MVDDDQYADSSDKLSNLEDYLENNNNIYYIVNENIWIATHDETFADNMSHAVVSFHGECMDLIFHEKCWFKSDDMRKLPSGCSKLSGKKGIRVVGDYSKTRFIEFLDNNQAWLNRVASVNYRINCRN